MGSKWAQSPQNGLKMGSTVFLSNLEIPAKLPAKNPLRYKTVKGALL